jgi:hypothetical protein
VEELEIVIQLQYNGCHSLQEDKLEMYSSIALRVVSLPSGGGSGNCSIMLKVVSLPASGGVGNCSIL